MPGVRFRYRDGAREHSRDSLGIALYRLPELVIRASSVQARPAPPTFVWLLPNLMLAENDFF
jgi:hypothetical protein